MKTFNAKPICDSKSDDLFTDVLALIRKRSKSMSDDEVSAFHDKLKGWVNKAI